MENKQFEKDMKDLLKTEELSKEKQHKKGKLSAFERIDLLLDEDSFVEVGSLMEHEGGDFGLNKKKIPRDGVVCGYGTVDGRRVFIYSQDFSAHGGTLGKIQAKKIESIMHQAIQSGAPIIGLIDSGGARIEEGIDSLDGYGKIFTKNVEANGIVPQISVILGNCAGGAAYSPGLTDFVFMVEGISNMFITGPRVIKKVTGEDISLSDLGSAKVHSKESGVAHFVSDSEEETIKSVQNLISYLPSNYLEKPPLFYSGESLDRDNLILDEIVSEDASLPYNMKEVIDEVFDQNSFFEVHKNFANNVIVGFSRLNGNSVGIVANQPSVKAGCLDIVASEKITRFVNFCDSFNIPIINLVDVPGYFPGVEQESKGIIKHGAGVLYAYANATVPKIAIILRKAFGGAYIALSSKCLKYDMVFAWPSAQIAVMGAEQACEIIYRKELKDETFDFQKKVREYEEKYLNYNKAARNGSIDEIIRPKDTRKVLIRTLNALQFKREQTLKKKHSNIPM